MDVILTIDQGTTNTKALLVNREGRITHQASSPVEISFPQPGWVEQDPATIWESVVESVNRCLEKAGNVTLLGIGISNQRESALIWDRKSGKPLGPVIVWQCRRTASYCNILREEGLEDKIWEKTGLLIDPLFSASKMRWLLEQLPDGKQRAEKGEICAGTIDSWLLYKLTSGIVHACDVTNASRTQLLNLNGLTWDEQLLDLFEIPAVSLPDILASSRIAGETEGVDGIPDGTPIASMIGDSHAALFGQGGYQSGAVKATYGTGSSIMSPTTGLVLKNRKLATTIAWGIGPDIVYALEGNITSTGATIQWVADLFEMERAGQVADLAAQMDDSEGVYIVPAFAGLGAPHWKEHARGLICGLTRGVTSGHLAKAAVESIAFQVFDVFDLMEQVAESSLDVLLADGGGSRNNSLMQFQADILNRPLMRNNVADISAIGAAYLAGLALGVWNDLDELANLPRDFDRFEPVMSAEMRDRKCKGWQEAVARTLYES